MDYEFRCEKCNKETVIDIPMNEYTNVKDKQVCSCGGKLNRILAFSGSVELCKGCYGIDSKKGGWNS